ncbi:hypothetical protein NFI96_001816 [Prochilodus magdalenae]|nr:hypothetical protein NFI96_001816 [Prochilodus magdalenae]
MMFVARSFSLSHFLVWGYRRSHAASTTDLLSYLRTRGQTGVRFPDCADKSLIPSVVQGYPYYSNGQADGDSSTEHSEPMFSINNSRGGGAGSSRGGERAGNPRTAWRSERDLGLMNAIGLQPRHPAPSVTSQGTQTQVLQLQNAGTQTDRDSENDPPPDPEPDLQLPSTSQGSQVPGYPGSFQPSCSRTRRSAPSRARWSIVSDSVPPVLPVDTVDLDLTDDSASEVVPETPPQSRPQEDEPDPAAEPSTTTGIRLMRTPYIPKHLLKLRSH